MFRKTRRDASCRKTRCDQLTRDYVKLWLSLVEDTVGFGNGQLRVKGMEAGEHPFRLFGPSETPALLRSLKQEKWSSA